MLHGEAAVWSKRGLGRLDSVSHSCAAAAAAAAASPSSGDQPRGHGQHTQSSESVLDSFSKYIKKINKKDIGLLKGPCVVEHVYTHKLPYMMGVDGGDDEEKGEALQVSQ